MIITEVSRLPEVVSNNAVSEGFIGYDPYVFSFGGIDNSKIFSGIHKRCFRYNVHTKVSERIPDIPDHLGKIAAAASRIGNIIYIIGGYSVLPDGSEISSNKVHRYNILENEFLTDGADLPIPIDDHVQVVWNECSIYVITGWSNTTNIPNIQIYNPQVDQWSFGTSMPNTDDFTSFGASGSIIGNTIYYFGGADRTTFKPQNSLRIGKIDFNNPESITWLRGIPDPEVYGYRMSCATVDTSIYWIGGSTNTYNFDGKAYDGSGGVCPGNRILYNSETEIKAGFKKEFEKEIPMDLRGVASISRLEKYIAGGMLRNQQVTDKIYKVSLSHN